jgi:hypothetical protein
MKFTLRLALILFAALWCVARAQTPGAPSTGPQIAGADAPAAPASSLVLTPAVIMVRCKPGESTTQVLTIVNNTAQELSFTIASEDVVVLEGKRSFSAAGKIANGIASSVVATPPSVVVKAGEAAAVQVTVTLPAQTPQRAVVTFFRGGVAAPVPGSVALAVSMGTLVTFNLSTDYQVEAGPVQASPQTDAANTILSEELYNRGSEPVLPKGVIVILNASGRRMAKASFGTERLLPGERLIVAATNPIQLPPGRYRTFSSFEFERKVVTSAGEFTIPK